MTTFTVPSGYAIRALRPDDSVPADLPAPVADQDSRHWRRTLVAVADDAVVGLGSIALAPVTDSYLVEVDVRPDHRRQGVGTALVRAVCELAEQPFPVRGRAMSSQPWRRAFAESLGCADTMSYPGPWIDPAGDAGQEWAARQPVPSGYSVRPVAEIDPEALAQAWASYAVWAHRPFGVVRLERVLDDWPAYAGGLDQATSMVALAADGSVVAFSLVTPDGWQGRTFVVSETAEQGQPDGEALVRAVVAASLRELGAAGVRLVELEGHSTDAHSPALVASLPDAGADPMQLVELVELVRA